jgi:hypothetical protein
MVRLCTQGAEALLITLTHLLLNLTVPMVLVPAVVLVALAI